MVKVKVLGIIDGVAVCKNRNTLYFIDAWRHCHNKVGENLEDKPMIEDVVYIEEWFLQISKNKLLSVFLKGIK